MDNLLDKSELPAWRKLELHERAGFMAEVATQLAERQAMGLDKYGSVFQGDPLDQLIEELLDALFYAWMTKRRYNSAYNSNAEAAKAEQPPSVS